MWETGGDERTEYGRRVLTPKTAGRRRKGRGGLQIVGRDRGGGQIKQAICKLQLRYERTGVLNFILFLK